MNRRAIQSIIVILLLFNGLQYAQEASLESAFQKGNQLYNQKNYTEAIQNYKKVLRAGYESGKLYYNLGNAYYKNGEIGKAILNYERARKFLPDDKNIEFNLELARLKIKDKIDRPSEFIIFRWIQEGIDNLTATGWALVFSITIFIISVIYAIQSLSSSERIRNITRPLMTSFVLILLLSIYPLYYQHKMQNRKDRGIILKEEIETVAAPQRGSTTLFLIHKGTKVKIIDRDDNWLKIELIDGKQGWIESEAIGII
ncbi:MAG: tetratricopeptide repeat protein [Candidatus Marinimicrobia bacterium]|nr:tetratricopeptide repeat protein [Candidatus Neomarinimicrobiota bacterium]